MKGFLTSFVYAWRGIVDVVRHERNMRVHVAAACVVVVLAITCRISALEWALLVVCMGMVMALEALNSAVEATVDRIGTERDELARRAKDASAGAVLIASCASAVVGAIIFIPRLWALVS